MDLSGALPVYAGDRIALVGAGGKTAMLSVLADEFKSSCGCKALFTTTTKLGLDQSVPHGFAGMGERALADAALCTAPGVYFIVSGEDREAGKLLGFSPKTLARYISGFDVCVMEADGARQKLLKGWAAHEPVIPAFVTKTVGIINLRLVGKHATDDNIHRLDAYLKLSGDRAGGVVTLSGVERVVRDPEGLFRGARGERILFVNMAESLTEAAEAERFLKRFEAGAPFSRAVTGSLFRREYHVCTSCPSNL